MPILALKFVVTLTMVRSYPKVALGGRTVRCARAVHALCEKLAVLHLWEFGKFRRLKERH